MNAFPLLCNVFILHTPFQLVITIMENNKANNWLKMLSANPFSKITFFRGCRSLKLFFILANALSITAVRS